MDKLNIHYFQHVEYENLGCIEEWANDMGHKITYTKFFKADPLPQINNLDWLIILGGPMNIYEENKYSWLIKEKEYIKQAIEANKTIIGICLGAQLIANALGVKVFPNKEKEIGFLPITMTREAEEDVVFKLIPKELDVFHWHTDTFDLPKGAKHLAYSKITKNQAFIYNEKIIGLQFHFEMQKNNIKDLINNNRNDLIRSNYVQSEGKIKTYLFQTIELNVYMKCILERLHKYT